ncbi:MAG: transposase [Saprospiraceae bacterium]
MKPAEIKPFYRRNLPHIQPIGAAFFVTFRLQGSIPQGKLFELKKAFDQTIVNVFKENTPFLNERIYDERKRFFGKYDALLDGSKTGHHYLKQPEIAELVVNELLRFNGDLYDLIAYCIMSNHVHILIDTSIQIPESYEITVFESLDLEPLSNIMKKIKGPTAVYANRLLNRSGKFWQRESYDHYVRNQKEFENIIRYILENPVKAGLVSVWEEYPFSFLKQ